MSVSGYNPSDFLPSAQNEPTGSMAQQAAQSGEAAPKLTPVTDPAILAKLNAGSKLTPVTDPSILARLNKGAVAPSKPGGSILGDVGRLGAAAASSFGLGAIEGARSLGHLANQVLGQTVGRIVPSSWNQAANNISTGIDTAMNQQALGIRVNPYLQEARQQFPTTAGIAETAGAMGSQLLGMNAAAGLGSLGVAGVGKAAGAAAEALPGTAATLGNVANTALLGVPRMIGAGLQAGAKTPFLAGAAKQGLIGGGLGAAGDPENPVSGFETGALFGGALGGMAGSIGERVHLQARILNDAFDDVEASGINPFSLEGHAKIVDAAKNGGVELRKFEADKLAMGKAEDLFNDVKSQSGMPIDQHPLNWVADNIEKNLASTTVQNAKNYDPINKSTVPVPATNYNQYIIQNGTVWPSQITFPKNRMLASTPEKIPVFNPNTGNYESVTETTNKTVLPTINTPMPLNQMLDLRRQFDSKIQQAQGLIKVHQMTYEDSMPLIQARQALDSDIDNTAAQIPYTNPEAPQVKTLKDQLQLAEDYNNQFVQPFKQVNKAGKYLPNPTTIPQVLAQQKVHDKILSSAGQILNSQRPNFEKFHNVATMLGPQGKEQLTNAMISRMFELSKTPAGEEMSISKPNTLNSHLTQFTGKGILADLATPEQQNMVKGISNILTANSKTPSQSLEQSWLGEKLNFLTKTREGVALLRTLGSENTLHPIRNALILNTLNGLKNYKASQPVQQDQQDLQDVQSQQSGEMQ